MLFDKRSKNFPVRSKFHSGSKDFIEKLETTLQGLGLPKRNIYVQKTKNAFLYMFKYSHKDSQKLFDIMYKNVENRLFLERKYKRFCEGLREGL